MNTLIIIINVLIIKGRNHKYNVSRPSCRIFAVYGLFCSTIAMWLIITIEYYYIFMIDIY